MTDRDYDNYGVDLLTPPYDIGEFVWQINGTRGGPSILNADTLAHAIRYAVQNYDTADDDDREYIRDFYLTIANALDHSQAPERLRLKRPRGRSDSYLESDMRENREQDVAFDVFTELSKSGKLEAAVSKIQSDRKISRATVFRMLKRAADRERLFKETDAAEYPDCPVESHEFDIWLDQFGTQRERK